MKLSKIITALDRSLLKADGSVKKCYNDYLPCSIPYSHIEVKKDFFDRRNHYYLPSNLILVFKALAHFSNRTDVDEEEIGFRKPALALACSQCSLYSRR